MILSFRKLSGKNLALLSIIKAFHSGRAITIKQNPYLPLEVLEVNKSTKVNGRFSILNYLSKVQRSSAENERLWWSAFTLNSKQVTPEHTQVLNQWLSKSQFVEGNSLAESDVIAYLKLKKANQLSQAPASWVGEVSKFIDHIVDGVQQEFAGAKEAYQKVKEKEKAKEQKPIKTEKPKEQQQQQTQKPAEAVAQKPKAPPKQQQKKQEEQDPEYLKKFNSLKVRRTNEGKPILPVANKRNVLITSALPYVNNVPHLGNIIGCVLSADVFARYCRLRGYNTLYICGTDEYGTATEVKALQEKCSPEEICAKYFKIHKECYDWFDIDFDYFGRTSTPIHTKITQDIFMDLHPKYTTQHTKPQTYCESCNFFLADRYVQGDCPHCGFDDARGDQCDSCQKLLDPVELGKPKCFICKHTPKVVDTTHIYINLPTIQPKLEEWISQRWQEGNWSDNSISVSKAWIKQGLKERCITRDLKWGTPVPLEEFKSKVFYVWFDAPIGYLSITGNFIPEWEQWWKNPDNVKLYQFMGKDNVPFHTVIFPSTLLGTEQPYTMLHRISTTEYLNYEDDKFSKTRGIGVFGDNIVDSGIPAEVIRYYLLINRPEKSDTVFTWQDFGNKNNTELLPNIGNLINRVFKFIYKNYDQKVPNFSEELLTASDKQFLQAYFAKFDEYLAALELTDIKDGLKRAMELSSSINKYLQDEKAWEKEQQASKRSDQVIGVASCAIRLLSAVFEPYMPSLSAKINFMLGFESRTQQDDVLLGVVADSTNRVSTLLSLVKSGQQLNEPVSLFRTYTPEELDNWKKRYGGQQKQ